MTALQPLFLFIITIVVYQKPNAYLFLFISSFIIIHNNNTTMMMHSQQDSSSSSAAAAPAAKRTMTPDEKVNADLATLSDQIDAARSLLSAPDCNTSSDVDANETLLVYVGFLEACVPRMEQLVEGALGGKVGEETLEKILLLNDRLNRTLDDCDNPSAVMAEAEGACAAAAAAPAEAAPATSDDNFDPFGETMAASAALPAAADEDDPFASLAAAKPAPADSSDPFA